MAVGVSKNQLLLMQTFMRRTEHELQRNMDGRFYQLAPVKNKGWGLFSSAVGQQRYPIKRFRI